MSEASASLVTVLLERCSSCGNLAATAREFCAVCGSHEVSTHHASGIGAVWSITVLHRPGDRIHAPAEFSAIAIVSADCGVRMMMRVPASLSIGDRVEFERTDLGAAPRFICACPNHHE